MEKKLPPHELRYDDLIGVVTINLKDKEDFNTFASGIAGYNPERFEAVALKVFIEHKPIVTIYALDKEIVTGSLKKDKKPVHKFKIEMNFEELFGKFRKFSFTVVTGDYNIEEMEVVNK